MTWFGTILALSPKTEWFLHCPLGNIDNAARLQVVESNYDPEIFLFNSQPSMPRALPAIAKQHHSEHRTSLLCVDNRGSIAKRWHYFSSEPDGTIAIDRPYVSDWESFFLLSNDQIRALSRLIKGKSLQVENYEPEQFLLGEQFKIPTSIGHADLFEFLNKYDPHSVEKQTISIGDRQVTIG
ncbi:MAG: hypothetical protein INR71_02955 [Terriglobus roseus]|nr:hypothetical protein [Terriglobus roseus]